ncbi:MAG TPA: hypothetical protein VGF93_22180 [Solirubrobacteraceae bacterium]|jgi:hypothetical protein
MASELRNLDADRAAVLETLCEAIVPGSTRVGPVLYIDALMSQMPEGERDAVLASVDALADAAAGGSQALAPLALTPGFLHVRALAIEAFYSDFAAPGCSGPSAYQEIDFHSPLAMRIAKDWSYLGIAE